MRLAGTKSLEKSGGMPVLLVTGGSGFMGSHVAEHLLKLGHEVVVLDDLKWGLCRQCSGGRHFPKGVDSGRGPD